jgi:hypothetical protein
MSYFAHSPKNGMPAQTYTAHIQEVAKKALENAQEASIYGKIDGTLLTRLVEPVADKHDMGKLERENQLVPSVKKSAQKLPYHHQDAGVAHFLDEEHFCHIAATVISSHHAGLPDFSAEANREEYAFRDKTAFEKTNGLLPELEKIHNCLISARQPICDVVPEGNLPVFMRLLLSCLVDADHTNTAKHYGKYPQKENTTSLRPTERLESLNNHVANLGGGTEDRDVLRREMYVACRDADITAQISSCDSPVGSGKTTAVMAHLLVQAQKRGLRRILVVLPFTNIIQQSVEVYREALVLPGENPEDVVAELHHRADFESEDTRHLSALWRAPIIVTTAVAFFECLASNTPSTLRRLHELPGSAVFVDESHASLPANLLPIAWQWMNIYADEWSCYWVLASGSLCRFWQIKEIAQDRPANNIPEIVDENLRGRLAVYEQNRISYKSDLKPKSIGDFIDWVANLPGPRLVILNTVQSAAVLADSFASRFGRECAEHLSTSLTPNDRENTLKRVKSRLKDQSDINWVLFATSCVEAGVNLSFRHGFRELGTLVSLLQAAGRINRDGKNDGAQIWTFVLTQNNMLKNNPSLKDAINVLRNYFEKQTEIAPELSTDSVLKEIRLKGVNGIYQKLLEHENIGRDFKTVKDLFNVIDSNTRITVVDPAFVERIRYGKVDWRELQKNSVQIPYYKLKESNAPEILPGIYLWNLQYDSFLGYMAGIVELKKFEGEAIIV